MRELQNGLQTYYKKTSLPYISRKDFPQLIQEFSLPSVAWRTAQSTYSNIPKGVGQIYLNAYGQKMAYRLVVECAVTRYCESQNPPLSTLSGTRYRKPQLPSSVTHHRPNYPPKGLIIRTRREVDIYSVAVRDEQTMS